MSCLPRCHVYPWSSCAPGAELQCISCLLSVQQACLCLFFIINGTNNGYLCEPYMVSFNCMKCVIPFINGGLRSLLAPCWTWVKIPWTSSSRSVVNQRCFLWTMAMLISNHHKLIANTVHWNNGGVVLMIACLCCDKDPTGDVAAPPRKAARGHGGCGGGGSGGGSLSGRGAWSCFASGFQWQAVLWQSHPAVTVMIQLYSCSSFDSPRLEILKDHNIADNIQHLFFQLYGRCPLRAVRILILSNLLTGSLMRIEYFMNLQVWLLQTSGTSLCRPRLSRLWNQKMAGCSPPLVDCLDEVQLPLSLSLMSTHWHCLFVSVCDCLAWCHSSITKVRMCRCWMPGPRRIRQRGRAKWKTAWSCEIHGCCQVASLSLAFLSLSFLPSTTTQAWPDWTLGTVTQIVLKL